jgi:hypothetical protein
MAPAVLRYNIRGSRRFSNYVFAVIIAIGGIGFTLGGLSSFFKVDLLPNSDLGQLQFIPQGLALSFYGLAGILLDAYLWLVIALDVGGGYNEFDRERGIFTIHRLGFWGKNRVIHFEYPLADVLAVRVDINNGFNPRRALYLKVKGRMDIPLSEVRSPMPLAELENQAAELAKFLGVPLEGL